jgi:hypothetical protein
MAITVSGTTVTFNDGTVQSTEASLLSAVQFTAYSGGGYRGQQNFQTSQGVDLLSFVADSPSPSSSSSVLCGFQAYRSSSSDTTGDSNQDTGTIQRRTVYRSVSGA